MATKALSRVVWYHVQPFYPANAAWVDATAARWAARGFTSTRDIFADDRGFPAEHGGSGSLIDLDGDTFYIRGNAFKWHAACCLMHRVIEAGRRLREAHELAHDDIEHIALRVPANVRRVCDIAAPATGLEIKFSLPIVTAFALTGIDSANPDSFSDAGISDAALQRLRAATEVRIGESMTGGGEVEVRTRDERTFSQYYNPHDGG